MMNQMDNQKVNINKSLETAETDALYESVLIFVEERGICMHKVTYFHLDTCPYCVQADQVIAELIAEHPEWAGVEFEKINEYEHPEIADQYDYYANPCMFIGKEKIYEGHIGEKKAECREHVEAVFHRAMEP